MPEIHAYLALAGINESWPGVITFDREEAKCYAGKRGRVHKLGTFTCDRVINRNGQTAIVVNGETYVVGYDAIRNGVLWTSEIGEPYTTLVLRHAAERDPLAGLH